MLYCWGHVPPLNASDVHSSLLPREVNETVKTAMVIACLWSCMPMVMKREVNETVKTAMVIACPWPCMPMVMHAYR